MQARKRQAEHEAEMGDLRSEFQEFLQADEGKLTQMARLLASIQDLQQERDSLSSQLTEAHTSSEVAQPVSRSLHQRPADASQSHAVPVAPPASLLCVPGLCHQPPIYTWRKISGALSMGKPSPKSLQSCCQKNCLAKAVCGVQNLC